VHQDIYVTTQMLVDPAETVVLLPAQTRYEQAGGGTETSTERRIIFSPEIPGPRIGEARAEWQIFQEVAARVRPEQRDRIVFASAQAIREEISRVVPSYKGIEGLSKAGDNVQYGGRLLYQNGQFTTSDGKAHFTPVQPPTLALPPGRFALSTRRGKQFNSLVHARKDPLTGAERDHLLMSGEDATKLGVAEGQHVEVHSDNGTSMTLRAHIAPILPGNVQAFWPECNALLRRRVCEPASGVPDYNALVEIVLVHAEEASAERIGSNAGVTPESRQSSHDG
ncbi:MAG TPA: molybdopterin dinucleotide binding domain-containing protein, partial [Ktedonobacterales bacterium]|nr:molybdopterin dinucleotide binding domain-containing protein [Ktedonobacterales bacterium]